MKILVVSSYLPYPLYSGGHIRLYNILKKLSKTHDTTLICEKRDYQTKEDVEEIEKICQKVITVDRKKQWSLENIIKTGFSGNSFLITGHASTLMNRLIGEELASEKYDLIHAETSYIMQNIPATSVPIVLVEHNIEYLVYQRFASAAPFIVRPLLALDVKKLQKQESAFWKRATQIVTVSEEEKEIIGNNNVSVVPNGVDTEKFKVQNAKLKVKEKEKNILFIGDFKWVQNRDAVRFIIKEIWPKIESRIKNQELSINMKLWIVGRNIPNAIKCLSDSKNIVFDENAPEDTAEIYRKADVLLSPIRIGGGTQYKILEAMASGTPVVTTPLGLEGIHATADKEILIGETIEDIAEKTIALFTNEMLYKELAANARKVIEKEYTWDTIVAELEKVYKKVV